MKHRRCHPTRKARYPPTMKGWCLRRHSEVCKKKIASFGLDIVPKRTERFSFWALFSFLPRKLNSSSVRWTMARKSVMSEPTPDPFAFAPAKSPTVVVTFGHRKDEDA